jgi:hypothetical protein
MLVVLLMFSRCSPNCDVAFKIINRLKVNNHNFKFNGDFKSYITVVRILEEHLAFPSNKKTELKKKEKQYIERETEKQNQEK